MCSFICRNGPFDDKSCGNSSAFVASVKWTLKPRFHQVVRRGSACDSDADSRVSYVKAGSIAGNTVYPAHKFNKEEKWDTVNFFVKPFSKPKESYLH